MQALSLQQTISWFTTERREWLVAVCFAFAAGYGVGNGHTTTGAIVHISDQLGQTKSTLAKTRNVAGCEHYARVTAVRDANAAEQGADVDLRDVPSCPGLPKPKK